VELISSSVAFQAPDDVSETLTLTYESISIFQRPIAITGEVDVGGESVAEYQVFASEE
jgi:hypothetical protein